MSTEIIMNVRTFVVNSVSACKKTGWSWKGNTKDVSDSVVRSSLRRCDISDYSEGERERERESESEGAREREGSRERERV